MTADEKAYFDLKFNMLEDKLLDHAETLYGNGKPGLKDDCLTLTLQVGTHLEEHKEVAKENRAFRAQLVIANRAFRAQLVIALIVIALSSVAVPLLMNNHRAQTNDHQIEKQ